MGKGMYNCVKILFIILNIVFLVIGFAIVGVGAYVKVDKGEFLDLLPKYAYIAVVMIVAGVLVICVSVIGFLGVCMESQCLLMLYFLGTLVTFGMTIAAGILGFVRRKEIEDSISDQLLKGLHEEKNRAPWDWIQKEFTCCGVNNATDWYEGQSTTIPDSCCRIPNCGQQGITLAYKEGCLAKFKDYFDSKLWTLGGVGIGLGVFMICLIVSSMFMCCQVRRKRA